MKPSRLQKTTKDYTQRGYIQDLENLTIEREKYKKRNDEYRYTTLGLIEHFAKTAPLAQKPVTDSLSKNLTEQIETNKNLTVQTELLKNLESIPKEEVNKNEEEEIEFDEIEQFENIIEKISSYPKNKKPAFSIQFRKTKEGYKIGKELITMEFFETGNNHIVFSNGVSKEFTPELQEIFSLPKLKENDNELDRFSKDSITNYLFILEQTGSSPKSTGNYKQAVRIFKDAPPSFRIREGKGIPEDSITNRILTLIAAKNEGHNNVDEELNNLIKKLR